MQWRNFAVFPLGQQTQSGCIKWSQTVSQSVCQIVPQKIEILSAQGSRIRGLFPQLLQFAQQEWVQYAEAVSEAMLRCWYADSGHLLHQ